MENVLVEMRLKFHDESKAASSRRSPKNRAPLRGEEKKGYKNKGIKVFVKSPGRLPTTHHHPKPIVGAAVGGPDVDAVGRTTIPRIAVPAAAAKQTALSTRRANRVRNSARSVAAVPIVTPLRSVAVRVEQAPVVRFEQSARPLFSVNQP